MIDKSKIYFFHNVYGDADELIRLAPEEVIMIPFGWDEESEAKRNEIIEELGVVPSCLPSIMVWKDQDIIPSVTTLEGIEVPGITIDARWLEIPVGKSPKYLWNWMHIMSIVEAWKNG